MPQQFFLSIITNACDFYLKACHAMPRVPQKSLVAERGILFRFLDSIKETSMDWAQKTGRGRCGRIACFLDSIKETSMKWAQKIGCGTRGMLFSGNGVGKKVCGGPRKLCHRLATILLWHLSFQQHSAKIASQELGRAHT
jgi:hypothetical protein